MAGFSPMLNALGAGLGMGVNDLMQQRQREQQMASQQLGMQRELAYLNMYLQNQQANQDVAALAGGLGGGLPGAGGSSVGALMGPPAPLSGPQSAAGRFGGMSLPPGGMAGALNLSGVSGPLAGQPAPPANLLPWQTASASPASYADLSGPGAPTAGPTPMTPNIPPPRDGGGDFAPVTNNFPYGDRSPDNPLAAQPSGVRVDPLSAMADPAQGRAAPQGQQYAQAAEQGPTWADAQAIVQQRVAGLGHVPTQKAVNDAIALVFKQLRTEWQERNTARTQERGAVAAERAATAAQTREELAGRGNPEALLVKQPDGTWKSEEVTYDKRSRSYSDQYGKKVEVRPMPKADEEKFGDVNYLMRSWHQDFVKAQGREPSTDEIATKRAEFSQQTKPPGQIAQNVAERIMIGGNEVNKAVAALTKLGPGATLGIFGGAQAALGPDMIANMKRNFGNKLVSNRDQMVASFGRGIGRGLAQLAGAGSAQGLQNLSDQLAKDMPQDNDTWGNILAKYASIRDTADGALEVLQNDPRLTPKQQAQVKDIMAQIQKAIPFTRADVAAIAVDDSDESIAQFARRMGVMKGDTGGTSDGGTPKPGPDLSGKSTEDLLKILQGGTGAP